MYVTVSYIYIKDITVIEQSSVPLTKSEFSTVVQVLDKNSWCLNMDVKDGRMGLSRLSPTPSLHK